MKEKIEIEVVLQITPKLLYKLLSTEEGLSKWFADKVLIKNNEIEFYWAKDKHEAIIIAQKENKFFKFSWKDDTDYFVEFSILPTEQNNLSVLKITDFANNEDKETTLLLWNKNIKQLKQSIGLS